MALGFDSLTAIEIEFGYDLLCLHTADISGSHQWDVDVRNEAVDRVAQHHHMHPRVLRLVQRIGYLAHGRGFI